MKSVFARRLCAFAAASLAAVALSGSSALAAITYTPVEGSTCSFNKYLILEAGAQVPNVTFSYTIEPGDPRSADTSDNTVMQVLAGVGSPTVSSTAFVPGQTTYTEAGDYIDVARTADERVDGVRPADGVEFEPDKGEHFAVTAATVDFSGVTFDEPGIYRYVITETASQEDEARGILHDPDDDRILDVYVTDDGTGTLVVSQYVLHTEDEDVAIGTAMGSADAADDGDALDDKTDGFTNEVRTSDLTFKKEVTGNQASRDKYFAFTLSLTNLTPGDLYTVSLADDGDENTSDGNADAVSGSNSATREGNRNQTNAAQLTADENGEISQVFYLQHGQSIAVRGLPLNAAYQVSEDAEDYRSVAAGVEEYEDPAAGTMAEDVMTSYLNERSGVIPTGAALTVLPGAAVLAAGGAGLFFLERRRAKRGSRFEA